jgi:hypothetical protein
MTVVVVDHDDAIPLLGSGTNKAEIPDNDGIAITTVMHNPRVRWTQGSIKPVKFDDLHR